MKKNRIRKRTLKRNCRFRTLFVTVLMAISFAVQSAGNGTFLYTGPVYAAERTAAGGDRAGNPADDTDTGAMKGTNHGLYEELAAKFDMQIVASGGVSSIDDVKRLAAQNIYGAIIGKAYYTGAIDLREAIAAGAGDEMCVAELLEEKK